MTSSNMHGTLRDRAIEADLRSDDTLSLASLWHELARGACKVIDCFFSDSRCYVLTTPTVGPAIPIGAQRMRILEYVLIAGGQKAVAIDFTVASSTVSSNAQQAIWALGARFKPSRPHPLLVLAAKSVCAGNASATGALSYVMMHDDLQVRVVSIPRPDLRLTVPLSKAEQAVVRGLVEGDCHADIALRRGISRRTVANQIGAVFRRFEVSGRGDLLHRLLADQPRSLPDSS